MASAGTPQRYRFGTFELQLDERRLLRGGTVVPLGPHAFDVLAALVDRAGHLVTKDALIAGVWRQVVVADNTLQVHVSALRKVLGRDAIATIPGSGYRFTLEVTRDAPSASGALDHRHNLPHALTSFIGRETQIAKLKKLLATARLLTLTGAGGCGKTRLALQLAEQLIDDHPDGAFVVELAALTNPDLVAQSVASVLGAREQARNSITDTVAEHIASRQMLLVLDNAEHLLEACARLVDTLLKRCGRLVILVTSREHLGVAGEVTFRIPSLSVPDPRKPTTPETILTYESARLFVDRARLHRPDFAVTEANAPAVASICRRLDGIPLAIELAAPCLRAMSTEEVDGRLEHRFSLLTRGSRTALPRQRTLRSLIDWSYDLLADAERAMLRRVAVFSGGWTVEAAERVCTGDDLGDADLLGLLAALVDKNLVVTEEKDGATRFGMLETILHYARDRLRESGEEEHVKRRHVECYVGLVDEVLPSLRGSRQQAALGRLEMEHDNLRAALAWCATPTGDAAAGLRLVGTLAFFWAVRGYLREGRDWIETLLRAAQGTPSTVARGRALVGAGVIVAQLGDDSAAKRFYEDALAVYRQVGDRAGEGYALRSLSNVAFAQADYATARALCEKSLVIARETGDRHAVGSLLGAIGEAAGAQGEHAVARRLLEESLAMAREAGDPWSTSWTLARLGGVAYAEHDYAGARALLQEALSIQREVRDPWGIAAFLGGFAPVALELGGPPVAARIWGGAERLRETIGAQMPSGERHRYEAQVARARTAMDDDAAFDLAWQDGRAMTMEQAIAHALTV